MFQPLLSEFFLEYPNNANAWATRTQQEFYHFRGWVQVGYQFKMIAHFKQNHEKSTNSPPHFLLLRAAKEYKKKLYDIFLGMGVNCLKIRATSRRQLTFLAKSNMWLNMSCLPICICSNQE